MSDESQDITAAATSSSARKRYQQSVPKRGYFSETLTAVSVFIAALAAVVGCYYYYYYNQRVEECKNINADCDYFATHGECIRNPSWMLSNCPVACDYCGLRETSTRCTRVKLNVIDEPVYKPVRHISNMLSRKSLCD